MRFWIAPGNGVPLYRQLGTQIVLAILSGELAPGERLPSTRSLARRYAMHSNTVSSAYRQLQKEGWLDSRRGSGVYVKRQERTPLPPDQMLDVHIAGFLRSVRELGLPEVAVKARIERWLSSPPADHLLLIEPDVEVARILLTELRAITTLPVRTLTPSNCFADRRCLRSAVPVCRPSQKQVVEEAVGADAELQVLPINSAMTLMAPIVNLKSDHLLAVVSDWGEFVTTAQVMLMAAGVSGDALLLTRASGHGRKLGIEAATAVICDAYTAARVEFPAHTQCFVVPLLAESARELVRLYEDQSSGASVV